MSIAILALVVLLTGASPVAAQSVENVRLSDPSSGFPLQLQPQLVVDSRDRVFVVWQEFSGLPGNGPVGFARSMDGGATWSRSLIARTPSGNSQANPWLATDELDRLYLARTEGLGALVSRSDDGATWGALADAHDGSGYPVHLSIESDENGVLYVAYSRAPLDGNINNWTIQVARSLDGGETWSAPKVLGTGWSLYRPLIATRPDGRVFVVWWAPGANFENIMVAGSSDRGETWRAPVRVNPHHGTAANNNFNAPARVPCPSLVTSSTGSLFIAWADVGRRPGFGPRDGLNSNILISRSDDDGATWLPPVRINDTPEGDQWTVALAIDRQNVLHAAWYDTRTGGVNLYYTSSPDGGATWSPNLKVTSQETPQASIAALGNYIGLAADRNGAAYMAWTDWRDGGGAIYFARTSACSAPSAPTASNNGPIRVGQTLQLTASTVAGAIYEWTGPSGFRSSLQNPSIPNATTAASGTYTVTAMAGGCASAPATTSATVLPPPCLVGNSTLCLNASRFTVEVAWRVPSQGTSGAGRAVPLTSDTGYFWFFDSANVELVVKVLDGRGVNGRFWVFYGALSDVEYTLTVSDTDSGAVRTYFNPQGRLASVADTSAF